MPGRPALGVDGRPCGRFSPARSFSSPRAGKPCCSISPPSASACSASERRERGLSRRRQSVIHLTTGAEQFGAKGGNFTRTSTDLIRGILQSAILPIPRAVALALRVCFPTSVSDCEIVASSWGWQRAPSRTASAFRSTAMRNSRAARYKCQRWRWAICRILRGPIVLFLSGYAFWRGPGPGDRFRTGRCLDGRHGADRVAALVEVLPKFQLGGAAIADARPNPRTGWWRQRMWARVIDSRGEWWDAGSRRLRTSLHLGDVDGDVTSLLIDKLGFIGVSFE